MIHIMHSMQYYIILFICIFLNIYLKETLPIKEVRYGDVKAGGDEYGSSTVGKLECKWDYLMGTDSKIFARIFFISRILNHYIFL